MQAGVIFFLMSIVYAIVHVAIVRRYKKELEVRDITIKDLRSLCDARWSDLIDNDVRYRKDVKALIGNNRILKHDIRILVSTDEKDAAKSKQVYDKWRAEFGMDEKREQR